MAVTLNLQHTFSTRVVFRSEGIEATRSFLNESRVILAAKAESSEPKDAALGRAGLKQVDRYLAMSDEDMVLSLTREAFKNGFRAVALDALKEFGVTRLGPLQTVKVSK